MGGDGSGNSTPRENKRRTVESTQRLDIRELARRGGIVPGARGRWKEKGRKLRWVKFRVEENTIWLTYSLILSSGVSEELSYPVRLDFTSCTYGGRRPWFLCPAPRCGRRVAVLYRGKQFACRHCYQLTYQIQREGKAFRAIIRYHKTLRRLGGSAQNPKPHRMHYATYFRLLQTQRLLYFAIFEAEGLSLLRDLEGPIVENDAR